MVLIPNQKSVIEALVSDLSLFNFVRSISVDAPAGSYSVTDTYRAVKTDAMGNPCQKYLETFEITQDTRNDGTKTVSINGTIEGLEVTLPLLDCDQTTPSNPIVDPDPAFTGVNTSGVLFPTHSGTDQGAKNTKCNNALSGWLVVQDQLYNRCLTINPDLGLSANTAFNVNTNSPYWLNPSPTNMREGFSAARGTITYSATFDNRPLGLVPRS